ncbi:calpain-8-like [Hyperolius riggenbachi]|uniref:calpain-8-like n=1 Tax=Hyperolius riggenbachi TaxID=752182 RepID=UPI0035A2FCBE
MASVAAQLAKDRSAALGLGTNSNPAKYLDQSFEELQAQCLASKTLFEDPTFPAAQSSLGVNDLGPKSEKVQGLEWKRPAEIKANPQFINEGANRADVRQGSLGDCWFLCSIASLTLNEEYLCQVVPMDQGFDNNYAGIFHFRFWQYGQWVDVVVDDRLPTKKGKLLFVKSTTASEFWSALLEKAYAKLNGSYEALKGGLTVEALEDFTGGVGELYYFQNAPGNLFQVIQKALLAKSLVTCSTKSESGSGEIVVSTNVVKNHAYSLTGAVEVIYQGSTVQIVRVRNPWGYKEWNGAWSDNSPEWNEVDGDVKAQLNLQCEDGETWMPFSSFLVEFYRVEICNLNLESVCCNDRHVWCLMGFNGRWTSGVTAGGCKGNMTFWTNPQFRINLHEPDEGYNGPIGDPCCSILVTLMQKERRKKKPQGQDLLNIGYYIYKVPKQVQTDLQLGKDFFRKNKEVACLDIYKNHREVSKRFLLPVGNYVIVPTTYKPCEEADFFLRVFTEKDAKALEFGNVVQANPYQPLSSSEPKMEAQSVSEEPEGEEREELSVEDLRSVLNQKLQNYPDIKCDGFGVRTCREMINLMDMDGTGTLSAEEFQILWRKLQHYMKIFLEVDGNDSGSIDAHEMRNALQSAGFSLNVRIQEAIIQRYVSGGLSVHFEDFIACLMRLEMLFKMFDLLDTNKSGNISLSLSEWLCAALI